MRFLYWQLFKLYHFNLEVFYFYMTRSYCNLCQRPKVSCICHLIQTIKNSVHVVILQHPSEVKQSKGTVTLLSKSLSSCQVFIGEDFSEHDEFLTVLSKYKDKIALLYPSEHAQEIKIDESCGNTINNEHIQCIILLDGTWKKAYRLYKINEQLKTIPHCILPDNIHGDYQIRKTKKHGGLSTLEACCHALAMIEKQPQRYTCIFDSFKAFNQMQLAFIPQDRS